jgi:ABC-type branched-subunit amino acid transport system substrate-binding protein
MPLFPRPSPGPFDVPLLAPGPQTNWIGVTVAPNKEYIGLSDGSIPFDFLRPDGPQKNQAARLLQKQDFAGAMRLLQVAVQQDTNDAEALISLENARIRNGREHCATFIVATTIIEDTGEGVNIGRDNLQGAFIVQKENNASANPVKICLDIANFGNDPSSAPLVARQIVNAAKMNKDIKGVMGWPALFNSAFSEEAISILDAANIPIVSPSGYDNLQFAHNVFHVAPSNQEQGERAALYAEEELHQSKAALVVDPFDTYSRSLAEGFKLRFEHDGKNIVALAHFTAGDTSEETFAQILSQVLQAHPDFIYFSGNAVDGRTLLT